MSRHVLLALVLGTAACDSAPAQPDASTPVIDARADLPDGPPVRRPCTEQLGNDLTTSFGRLDGILVAIVPPGGPSMCNADSEHVHLQIEAKGEVYDIAINVGSSASAKDVLTTTRDMPVPGEAWEAGWHTGYGIDYVQMGVRATDLVPKLRAELVSELTTELATVNHVTVFATGYGPDGAHLVHRNFGGRDGMLITQPRAATSRARLFSFADQSF